MRPQHFAFAAVIVAAAGSLLAALLLLMMAVTGDIRSRRPPALEPSRAAPAPSWTGAPGGAPARAHLCPLDMTEGNCR